jgi:hypothetical protein
MKVKHLIAELEEVPDGEAEVLLMSQPDRHALAYRIRGIEWRGKPGDEDIYIVEGSQIGYVSDE